MATTNIVNDYISGDPHGEKGRSSTEAPSLEKALFTDAANDYDDTPTEEERNTLRLVADKIPYTAWLIALVEFAERASYYGCSGPFSNFIQRPLPAGGNGAGATPAGTQLTPGALGLGLIAATGLTTTFSFLAYILPIAGGVLADTKWGRFRTICYGTAIAAVAHVILIIAAIPSVIKQGHAVAPFVIGLLTLAFGTGFIKSSVAVLMSDQTPNKVQRVRVLATGERVIVDPATTVQSIMLCYYWAINVGAFFKLATTYSEKRVGFWLAFLLPLIIFLIMPVVLFHLNNRLIKLPPKGSVLVDTAKVISTGLSQPKIKGESFYESAKPSKIELAGGLKKSKPAGWVSWDDDFVDELKRTFSACKIFAFLPIFYLADGGLSSITNSQAASMTTNGAPNDLLANFNPLTIIVVAPLLNYVLYPTLRKYKIPFGQVARIVTGFLLGVLTMVIGAILQWQVYKTSPCGYNATTCEVGTTVSPILVWAQLPMYSLPAIAELLVSVTCFEMAYTRAPQRMKGLVYALVLAMSALSSALVLIVSPSFKDPNLIWPFVGIAIANFIAAGFIWYFFGHLDKEAADLDIGVNRAIEAKPPGSPASDSLQEKGEVEKR